MRRKVKHNRFQRIKKCSQTTSSNCLQLMKRRSSLLTRRTSIFSFTTLYAYASHLKGSIFNHVEAKRTWRIDESMHSRFIEVLYMCSCNIRLRNVEPALRSEARAISLVYEILI